MISHNINGLLIKPKNSIDLSSKLKILFDSDELRMKLAKNARKTILENNTIEVAVEKFKNILGK